MALAATTLAANKAVNDIVINLTSATGAIPKMLAMVDTEWMRITSNLLTPTLGVVPGYNGSAASSHGQLAPVIYGVTQDFINAGITIGGVYASQSLGVDGAIVGPSGTGLPITNTFFFLTKATAGAYTIALPTKDQTNTITFISTTAAAHVLTNAAGFYGDTTGSDTATWPAHANATFTIRAQGGVWCPIATAGAIGVVIG